MFEPDRYLANTHQVENQAGALENYNLFTSDQALSQACKPFTREQQSLLAHKGKHWGTSLHLQLGHLANQHKPTFSSHNRFGERVDLVEFHPSYHQLMAESVATGLHALPWQKSAPTNGHQLRTALYYCHAQVEAGHGCPITMTFAAYPTLGKQPDVAARWLPLLTSNHYDGSNHHWARKAGVTLGMAMTEKQGGSDVRANTTTAQPLGQRGGGELYALVGHKYFVSAPMSDAFLTLAQTAEGLSCFLVPRWREDGTKNPLQIQQLKQKMGNASNASCETELRGAHGWLIGDEGRGIANILEMVALTRFDCMVGSAAGQRAATALAIHHCQHRSAFGAQLVDHPLMTRVLADLALESEASLALTWRMSQALDKPHCEHSQALLRIGTAVGKYWICKRTPGHAYEAMECIGGMGVMETGPMARLYREAPINAIWEGSGNVQCLDLLRVLQKHPECLEALHMELTEAASRLPALAPHITQLTKAMANEPAQNARHIMALLALCLQTAALVALGSPCAEVFYKARLSPDASTLAHQGLYGALPQGLDAKAVVARAAPLR
ncbi:acyl-CoA dehydrogenase family protein [Simiduia sp. 21SJ11W-1]|uniref:acyl-CoA dehydrogenase family protein n=1 Tax=Simiduia sp. 21SJ11W-1 TaxID=2909669 RepID=UPI00209E90BE|nr:acyl-CoA dehydrogenase family protein [Simiduia sp. 21SJ11W-1]UTA46547.1 acyl-CoA dehydrogenase family protein [Simiduia sp. 21SJ11W-1]